MKYNLEPYFIGAALLSLPASWLCACVFLRPRWMVLASLVAASTIPVFAMSEYLERTIGQSAAPDKFAWVEYLLAAVFIASVGAVLLRATGSIVIKLAIGFMSAVGAFAWIFAFRVVLHCVHGVCL